jgi:16S rRNA (uracil1498-N3)-methyltransferase
MKLFYSSLPLERNLTLDTEESRHAVKVLRLKKGDSITVTDGKGLIANGIIVTASMSGCILELNNIKKGPDIRDYFLTIAISPLTNGERFEWFVEKAVEIGVNEIIPLVCDHTGKQNVKSERLKRIVISAMKQSLKSTVTSMHEPVKFARFIEESHKGTLMIAHCIEGDKSALSNIYNKGSDATILIGPEGDFSPGEIASATRAGFIPITLGPSRLRTETAGVAACHSIYFMNL